MKKGLNAEELIIFETAEKARSKVIAELLPKLTDGNLTEEEFETGLRTHINRYQTFSALVWQAELKAAKAAAAEKAPVEATEAAAAEKAPVEATETVAAEKAPVEPAKAAATEEAPMKADLHYAPSEIQDFWKELAEKWKKNREFTLVRGKWERQFRDAEIGAAGKEPTSE